jgi:micrococcal nuclease
MFIHRYYPIVSVIRVLDGDTVNVLIDMGFGVRYDTSVRLMGIDAPEKTGITAPIGLLVKQCMIKMVNALVEAKIPLTVRSDELDMYGRVLGDIEFTINGVPSSLSKELIAKGLVQAYSTAHRPAWTPQMLQEAKKHAEAFLKA